MHIEGEAWQESLQENRATLFKMHNYMYKTPISLLNKWVLKLTSCKSMKQEVKLKRFTTPEVMAKWVCSPASIIMTIITSDVQQCRHKAHIRNSSNPPVFHRWRLTHKTNCSTFDCGKGLVHFNSPKQQIWTAVWVPTLQFWARSPELNSLRIMHKSYRWFVSVSTITSQYKCIIFNSIWLQWKCNRHSQ